MANEVATCGAGAGGALRSLLLSLFAAGALCAAVSAQSIDRFYVSKVDATGALYHVLPMDDLQAAERGEDLVFDITRHSAWDHAVLRFTLEQPVVHQVDSLLLGVGEGRCVVPVRRLHVDRARKTWRQRYEAEVPLEVLRTWLTSGQEAGSSLSLRAPGYTGVFHCSTAHWRKLSERLTLIMELIDHNRASR